MQEYDDPQDYEDALLNSMYSCDMSCIFASRRFDGIWFTFCFNFSVCEYIEDKWEKSWPWRLYDRIEYWPSEELKIKGYFVYYKEERRGDPYFLASVAQEVDRAIAHNTWLVKRNNAWKNAKKKKNI